MTDHNQANNPKCGVLILDGPDERQCGQPAVFRFVGTEDDFFICKECAASCRSSWLRPIAEKEEEES